MGKNTSVVLGEDLDIFVEGEVARGHYSSASEVVRAGLRLLEDQGSQVASLRSALMEGEQSGIDGDFDFDRFLREESAKAGG